MRKQTFAVALFLILISCAKKKSEGIAASNEQKAITKSLNLKQANKVKKPAILEIEPYDFDTILKNDFHLSYRVYKDTIENEMLQSLTLVKGNKDIKQISETSFPMLHKNLGYIGGDFGKTFLFVQSFGSGNPHEIQLIEKENGNVITEGTLVDSNEKEKVLLYIKNEHEKEEKLILLDIKNNKEKIITDFNDLKCTHTGGLRDCIVIDTVTKIEIIIKTDSEQDNVTKKYYR
ncbi:hypothetical protein GON26_17040 [Flavobacterium sp. GA093]|uniref:Lipoprotein n=1 Tax=Flavobacterium hydrocarbonoxydans TaxID=2683249 RepID=A0A6I4NYL7_9FLAO|nr:hypothetical protein [Flavobacterium hydrocarbonoxydans]MWB96074.1 hypothetical protein [Flavobacterium hydrocarbonoxydans]